MKYGKIFFFIILVLIHIQVSAQDLVTINEYGAYYINNGTLKKIPTDYRLGFPYFWKRYIVFKGEVSSCYFIYNTENGILSTPIEPGPWDGKYTIGIFNPVDKGPNLFLNYDGLEYEFDPVSLELINRQDVPLPEPAHEFAYDWFGLHWREPSSEYIGRRTYRHRTENTNYYLDVIFGPDIDLSLIGEGYLQGMDKQFVLIVVDKYFSK